MTLQYYFHFPDPEVLLVSISLLAAFVNFMKRSVSIASE